MYSPRRFHRPRPYKVSTWALDSSGKLLTQFPPTVLSDGCFSRTRRHHRNRWTAPTAINQFVPKILPSSTKVYHRTGGPDMKSRHTRAHTSTQNDVIWSQNDSKNRRTSGVRHRSDSWNALQKIDTLEQAEQSHVRKQTLLGHCLLSRPQHHSNIENIRKYKP